MDDNVVRIKFEGDTKSFDRQIDEVKDKLWWIDQKLAEPKKFGLKEKDIAKLNTQAEKLNNQLFLLNKKQNELNKNYIFESMGKSIEKVTKKVAKWALAVVGVRSIYLGIRRAISTLSQSDDKLSSNIEYMRWALANSIKPLIEWIIKALYTILGFVGRIIYNITGRNIFKDSGIGDYEKSLKNSDKSAKDLKKTIAGFDEMNVVSDNSSASSGGFVSPDFDLGKMVETKTKIEQIAEDIVNKWFEVGQEMQDALSNPEAFDKAYGEWSMFMQGLVMFFDGIWNVITGFVEFIGGILDIIVGLFTGNFDKVKQGFKFVCDGIWKVITGLLESIVAILKTIIGVIVGLVVGVFNTICSILGGIATFVWENVIKPVGNFFADMWNEIVEGASVAWEGIKSIFGAVASFFKKIFTDAWEGVKKVFSTGGTIFSGIVTGILEGFKRIVNVIIDGINAVVKIPFDGINGALNGLRGVDLWGWKPFEWVPTIKVPQIPRLKTGGIINQPGRGVALGGEAGREGVVPLTDSQAMAELGEAIGKYITINATITNTMNGRVISRELQKIQNEQDFAYNR